LTQQALGFRTIFETFAQGYLPCSDTDAQAYFNTKVFIVAHLAYNLS